MAEAIIILDDGNWRAGTDHGRRRVTCTREGARTVVIIRNSAGVRGFFWYHVGLRLSGEGNGRSHFGAGEADSELQREIEWRSRNSRELVGKRRPHRRNVTWKRGGKVPAKVRGRVDFLVEDLLKGEHCSPTSVTTPQLTRTDFMGLSPTPPPPGLLGDAPGARVALLQRSSISSSSAASSIWPISAPSTPRSSVSLPSAVRGVCVLNQGYRYTGLPCLPSTLLQLPSRQASSSRQQRPRLPPRPLRRVPCPHHLQKTVTVMIMVCTRTPPPTMCGACLGWHASAAVLCVLLLAILCVFLHSDPSFIRNTNTQF